MRFNAFYLQKPSDVNGARNVKSCRHSISTIIRLLPLVTEAQVERTRYVLR